MSKPNRVLILGLDGATWDVLGPWLEDGSLPNLARLRQNGCWGDLRSTIPPLTSSAWATFMTGKGSGKHSVFHFVDLFDQGSAGDGKPKLIDARNIKSPTLWDILAHHDRRVILVNVPMTFPPRPVNGLMITGLLTPKNASVFTYPPDLAEELDGGYIVDLDRFIDTKPFQSHHDPEAIRPSLSLMQEFQDMLEKRAQVSLSLMRERLWDVFMVVFTGTDRMGHYLWSYHRPTDTSSNPIIRELSDRIHRYYMRLDEIIGELVEEAGEDARVVVMSDHGMGPVPTKRFHCNNWLNQQGLLSTKSKRAGVTNPDTWLKKFRLPRDKIGKFLLRIPGLSKSPLFQKAVRSRATAVNLEQSQAHCVPIYNNIMGIRINADDERRQALRQEIVHQLGTVVDAETGQQVVKQIHLGHEYYHGPYANNIPDLVVVLDPDYSCGYHVGSYSSVVTKRPLSSDRGDHRLAGIFIASGPGIMACPEPQTQLAITDVAPTVLYMAGLPCPTDMDGRVLTEIVAPEMLASQPIVSGKPTGLWPSEEEAGFIDRAMSEEDDEQIRARLSALGYL